ncbi:hypothetical protein EMIT0373P_40304 [Pseudomonas chlororaphis]
MLAVQSIRQVRFAVSRAIERRLAAPAGIPACRGHRERIGQPEAVLKVGANREEIVTTLATTISLNAGAAHVYSLHDSLKS